MITNAKDIPLDVAKPGLPNMRTTISGWFQKMTLIVVRKITENFQQREVQIRIEAQGMVQPFTSRQLAIKPEGERSWNWNLIHVTADSFLQTDDQVTISGKTYRIMGQMDWDDYGFNHYEAVKDYAPAH